MEPTLSLHNWGNRLRDNGWCSWGHPAGLWQYLDKRTYLPISSQCGQYYFLRYQFVFRWLHFSLPSHSKKVLVLSSLSARTRKELFPPLCLFSWAWAPCRLWGKCLEGFLGGRKWEERGERNQGSGKRTETQFWTSREEQALEAGRHGPGGRVWTSQGTGAYESGEPTEVPLSWAAP